jgi:hypothetical protein
MSGIVAAIASAAFNSASNQPLLAANQAGKEIAAIVCSVAIAAAAGELRAAAMR